MANIQRYKDRAVFEQSAETLKLWRLRPKIFIRDVLDVTLDLWQEEVVESYQTKQRIGVVANKGPGKAQPLYIEIPTPSGMKKFGDLKPGDLVFGENGKPTKVMAIHPQGIKDNYRVTFDDGTSTECCDEHLWKVRNRNTYRYWEVLPLSDIKELGVSCYGGWEIPVCNKIEAPEGVELPEIKQVETRYISGIEKIEPTEMMCISVEDENHCYLTNDFIVTHNTALEAMLCLHFASTYYEPKIACLSITKDHLRDNLWSEILKWRGHSETLKRSLSEGSEKIHVIGKENIGFISARSFPKSADESQMQGALAGLHADNIAFFIDEAGGIPESIFATADAALANADEVTKFARLVAMGNPEMPSGTLYRNSKILREGGRTSWAIHHVTGDPDDPKRSPRVKVEWAREQIATFGRDHPYVKINVFGEYPETSSEQLISEKEIDDSMARDYKVEEYRNSENRMGVDVARGGKDSSVLFRRQGLKAFPPRLVGSDVFGPELAGIAVLEHNRNKIDKIYVDGTGGYGSSVFDSLTTHGEVDVMSIMYNARAQEPEKYNNRRTEIWMRMRDWIRRGGQLPNDDELRKELLSPKIFFHGGKFALEPKEDIKKRLGRSPDRADALAQTFADDEEFSSSEGLRLPSERMDYDTMIQRWKDGQLTVDSKKAKHYSDYDPLANLYKV